MAGVNPSNLIADNKKVARLLRCRKLVLGENDLVLTSKGGGTTSVSWPGRENFDGYGDSIVKFIESSLKKRQYTYLFYDGGFIQDEYTLKNNKILKARFLYARRTNKYYPKEDFGGDDEDASHDNNSAMPLLLRVDYDPANHKDIEHPAAHMTINNIEVCRIPMKTLPPIGQFVKFILANFYEERNIDFGQEKLGDLEAITNGERKFIHLDWS